MVVVNLMIQMNSIDLWMKKMTHYMNSLMLLMFDAMCNLLVTGDDVWCVATW
jgi:hypothetical protein